MSAGTLDEVTRKPYIGPSEAQSAAMAQPRQTTVAPRTDRPYLDEHWRSRSRSRNNGKEPPKSLDGLVAWYADQWALEWPQALHAAQVWADRVSAGEHASGLDAKGGSRLGSHRFTEDFRRILEEHPSVKDREGDLIRPLAASLSALRNEFRYGHDVLMAVAYAYFDWRAIVGQPFYRKLLNHQTGEMERVLVLVMPEDVLFAVLLNALTRLWWLLAEREPHIQAVD